MEEQPARRVNTLNRHFFTPGKVAGSGVNPSGPTRFGFDPISSNRSPTPFWPENDPFSALKGQIHSLISVLGLVGV